MVVVAASTPSLLRGDLWSEIRIERISQENIMKVFMLLVAFVLVRYVADVTQLSR